MIAWRPWMRSARSPDDRKPEPTPVIAEPPNAASSSNCSTVVAAPVTEEVAKLFSVVLVAFSRRFDGPVDGMVYGAASALGFAVTCALAAVWKQRLRSRRSASSAATGSCV